MENQTTERKKDLIIIGAPGSGKTTVALKHAEEHCALEVKFIDFGRHSTETWFRIKDRLINSRVSLIIVEGVRSWSHIEDLIFQLNLCFKDCMTARPQLIFTTQTKLSLGRLNLTDKYEAINLE